MKQTRMGLGAWVVGAAAVFVQTGCGAAPEAQPAVCVASEAVTIARIDTAIADNIAVAVDGERVGVAYASRAGTLSQRISFAIYDASGQPVAEPFEAHARVGTPGETIAKEAADRACDLIVMGTHGVGMTASLLGSVAQATIGEAKVPVLLVK